MQLIWGHKIKCSFVDSKYQILKLARTYVLRSKIHVYVIILILPWTLFIVWGTFGAHDFSVRSNATLGDWFMIFYCDVSSIENNIRTMNWQFISNLYGILKHIYFDMSQLKLVLKSVGQIFREWTSRLYMDYTIMSFRMPEENTVIWRVVPSGIWLRVVYCNSIDAFRSNISPSSSGQKRESCKKPNWISHQCLLYFSTLKMEALSFS
jgi:hypothetical protein